MPMLPGSFPKMEILACFRGSLIGSVIGTVLGVFGSQGASRFGRKNEILVLNLGDGGSSWNFMGATPPVVQVWGRGASLQKDLSW